MAGLSLDGATGYRLSSLDLLRPGRPRPVPTGLVEVHAVSFDGTLVAARVSPAEAARIQAAAAQRRDRIRYAALVGDPTADPAERTALAERLAEHRPSLSWPTSPGAGR